MDEYDYVVHGRVFKYNQPKEGADGKRDNKIEILASFGGLIMSLKGDPRNIKLINNDQKIYLLMRKVNA
jgi:DNA-directed RNA polymerase I, II, and III subunit RPABC3